MKNFKRYISLSIALSVVFSTLVAQDWEVPLTEKSVVSPIAFGPSTQQHGKDLFNTNCKSCHGTPGTESFLPLNPPPGDPASEKFSKQTDGELFYKITNGKGGMPQFKNMLSEQDRWDVISYIRTFHKDYKPANIEVASEAVQSFSGTDLSITLQTNADSAEVIAQVKGMKDGQLINASGVRVSFLVKRNFGFLPIGDPATTNEQGLAQMKYPTDLPGDSIGQYQIRVKLVDDDVYGQVTVDQTVQWGQAFIYDNPLNYRALWGNRANVPLWLLFSYFGIVGGVWITILWVVLQMLKLKKLK
ncbi:MAG: cytochrome c [Bacteroidales bacterium]|nr:cytochrome c [Bacteroidales bacterium]